MAEVRNEAINEVRKEYIEREALIEKLMNLDPPGFEHSIAGKVAIQVILASPAADVVEVVRCKDCRYFDKDKLQACYGECDNLKCLMLYSGYCSCGERKE